MTDTTFYDEIVRRFRRPVQTEDVNIETVPTLPAWNDSSNNTLFNLGSDDFASVVFTELHTSHSDTYTKNGTKMPGMYLDTSGTVALFVRLKLDKMEGDATTNLDASAIVYTKYPIDSSNTSLMDSAYQFNYNTQINLNSSISVFKPYNYTLEYSSDNSTFYQVTNDMGNWSFDTNSGTIIFEDDPKTFNHTIDLDVGDLYFTFVKYIGLQGIQNLIYYDKTGCSGIGTKEPLTELDISGTVIISENLEIANDLFAGLDTLNIDSSSNRVGINTIDPSDELHVVGNVNISKQLTIANGGFGAGMCPIGTIIIWTTTTAPTDYGTWLLCDGDQNYSANDYTVLSNILGSTSGGYIIMPNFENRYTKGGPIGLETDISYGGTGNTSDISLTEIPSHTHTFDQHTHNKSCGEHHHETKGHGHDLSMNVHLHGTNNHGHTANNTQHDHSTNHTHNSMAEDSSGHHHGALERISHVNWNSQQKGGGTSAINVNDEGTWAADGNTYDTQNTTYNVTKSANSVSGNLDSSACGISASDDNSSGGNCSGITNIISTDESALIDTSTSTVGISSTDLSTGVDTTRATTGITLKDFDDTHNLSRPAPAVVTEPFSFSATPRCIEIFYYIRAL